MVTCLYPAQNQKQEIHGTENLRSFIWSVAELLRDDFKQSEYGLDGDAGIIGYEIPFDRHFYKYAPPRSLEEIDADLDKESRGIYLVPKLQLGNPVQ